ncbi:MAG: DUF2273 domain-containing protein [Firmicutes bacterium]|nr:DUF2273 domain-containing protein [Bacillota bacterium]
MMNFWLGFLVRHSGKIIFSILGLIFGATVLSKGLFAACFLLLCLVVGYIIGKKVDQGEKLATFLERIFPYDR